MIAEGRLSAGHARALLATPDRAMQEQLAEQTVREGWTVREVEAAVRAQVVVPAVVDDVSVEKDPAEDPPALRAAALREPALLELEELLSARLDTRVNVSIGSKRAFVCTVTIST